MGILLRAANSIQDLVHLVSYDDYDHKVPGVYQLVIPAELVEETIHEFLPLLSSGDIIIDHGTATLKILRRETEWLEKLGIQYIDCGTSGGVYGLGVDIVLWLVVQILQYPSVLLSSGTCTRFICSPHRSYESCHLVLSMVGYIVVVQGWTLCQNGSQWCRIWNHKSLRRSALISYEA